MVMEEATRGRRSAGNDVLMCTPSPAIKKVNTDYNPAITITPPYVAIKSWTTVGWLEGIPMPHTVRKGTMQSWTCALRPVSGVSGDGGCTGQPCKPPPPSRQPQQTRCGGPPQADRSTPGPAARGLLFAVHTNGRAESTG
ncbi:hypothetical protein GWK47_038875 [Chionoecetes opilio]|uniref:Uncharacterized protein n=1 Tax=Chionoecetes opilio TaxID=41210 RepID=A0A8J4YKL7_CHIOP|nr:hypothetical protein GWK47_038875 [Chionoecetes opilio]